jgi:hypothetical protein
MKPLLSTMITFTLLFISGCALTTPLAIQPLRLYDLNSGSTIEVILHQTSRDHGTISSPPDQKGEFEGEYVLYNQTPGPIVPPAILSGGQGTVRNQTESSDLAERYGFGKNSDARPVGTGVIVGHDGTVIEIVFYRVSGDLKTGDGVAKDNKGRYYRIFLSTERQ